MSIFKRVSNLFRAEKNKDQEVEAKRTIHNLKVNDIITYDLEDYLVVGKLVYNHGGYIWNAYNLKGDTGYIWLSVEVDDEIELGIFKKIQTKIQTPDHHKLEIDGNVYYQEEQGEASITEVEGQAGAVVGQRVQYWSYEVDEDQSLQYPYLSVEKWGGDLEISKGYSISEHELTILAGS
ncbi:DUF4178 domain-containing protein [Metabacillus herbersteinensis]|uniref:DUF4178 domain-containing protein n=1 Tax=Metabacillus herbersteinensis TaxID=283816 RepID=A0ABV6GFT5_9BACI